MAEIDLSIPDKPHPITMDAYKLYGALEPGIRDDEARVLQERLDAIYPDLQEAYYALLALTAFALYVKQEGDEASNDRIMALVRDQSPHFEEVKHQVADENRQFRQHFAKLASLDTSTDKTAPKFGADKPKGSFKASNLLPNPALRRPPNKPK